MNLNIRNSDALFTEHRGYGLNALVELFLAVKVNINLLNRLDAGFYNILLGLVVDKLCIEVLNDNAKIARHSYYRGGFLNLAILNEGKVASLNRAHNCAGAVRTLVNNNAFASRNSLINNPILGTNPI